MNVEAPDSIAEGMKGKYVDGIPISSSFSSQHFMQHFIGDTQSAKQENLKQFTDQDNELSH